MNLNVLNNKKSIIFIDIDETIFRTFAKIYVIKNKEIVKKLSNKEFNKYELEKGESFDFHEFRDGKLFKETSIPIKENIKHIKKIISKIKNNKNNSKIVFLTAREDFLDKHNFLEKFREQGFDIDDKNLMYIERAGNLKKMSVAEKKKQCIINYLKEGRYNFVKIIDDDKKNIMILQEIAEKLPQEFLEELKLKYKVKKDEPLINFYGLLAKKQGKLELIFEKSVLAKDA